jgi:hypothetical protein
MGILQDAVLGAVGKMPGGVASIGTNGKNKNLPEELELQLKQLGYKKGGSVSASKRADGCAVRGKTKA